MPRLPFAALALVLTALSFAPLRGQEGLELGKMWTFENAPLEYLEAVYGFSPSQQWLDKTRLASLRFGGGCSASFVSKEGLILTNHHCARDKIAEISPEGQDWVKDGFIAKSRDAEVPVPGLTVQQLVAMRDVTQEMNAGLDAGDDDATIDAKRNKNQQKILAKAREARPDLKPEIVKLYHGGMFQLYEYRVYDDIRLVAAPELQIAHFGGDPDNFTYPRYCLDFALCRAYVDGKPADTKDQYFKWNERGPEKGELVFVTGSPGSTGRMLTHDTLVYRRDVYYPLLVDYFRNKIAALKAQIARNPEREKEILPDLLGLQNSRKAFEGYHGGLMDPDLMGQKKAAEKAFRAKVNADAELKAKYGDAWDRLADVAAERAKILPKLWFYAPRDSEILKRSTALANANGAGTKGVAEKLAAAPAIDTDLETAYLTYKFKGALHWLGMSNPVVRQALGGRSPEEAAASLIEKTIISNKSSLEKLITDDAEALTDADDPAIALVKAMGPLQREAGKRWQELGAQERTQIARIGQALFEVYGTKVSPDATFTLRLSDGVVKGFPCNGTVAPPFTAFYGLYSRNIEFENEDPFHLPERWLKRQPLLDLRKRIDFVSTNDIIGGNSGSPVINKNQEVVGLAFDGNIEMLPNRYLYRDTVARTVSVHCGAIIEALRKVFDADWVADELSRDGAR